MEVLAASIRAHPHIVGLSVPGLVAPLSVLFLYADDTSVVVASERAIQAVFSVYASFESASGSRLNLGKCEGLWLGSWRGRPDAPVPINLTSAHIKVLGVYIGHADLETANWRPRLDSVKRCLDTWPGRTLSGQGCCVKRPSTGPGLVCGVLSAHAGLGPQGAGLHGVFLLLERQAGPGPPCRCGAAP